MLVYWVPENQVWRGNGYECEGNPLEFFQFADARSLRTEAVARIPGMPAQVECVSITTSTSTKTNGRGEIEITPGFGPVVFTAEVRGDTAQGIEIKEELWTVNGTPKHGGQRQFTFLPTLVDYKTGVYVVAFRLTDQFGRVSTCPTRIVNIVPAEAPPLMTRSITPVTTSQAPPAKVDTPKNKKGCKKCLLLLAAGVIPLFFLGGDKKGEKSGVINPGGTPDPRPTSGGVTFSWGGRR
jgi:hypothetical protein